MGVSLRFEGGALRGLVLRHPPERARLGRGARLAAHAQVKHEARIVGGEAPELGCGHFVPAEELFDLAKQHAPDLL
jgi:hypothetical protein